MNRLIQFQSSRWSAMLLATVVAIITCLAVANATQTITTPNAVKITYNLAAGTNSAAITPASNTSVLVMACCTSFASGGVIGVGHMSLLHTPSVGMTWLANGMEGGEEIGIGTSATGFHITFIDDLLQVGIEVASADTIRIHNGSAGTRTGNVTLIW